MKSLAVSLVAAVLTAAAPALAANAPHRVVWDDFHRGYRADSPGAPWLTFSVGQGPNGPLFRADDGQVSTGPHGLSVTAPFFTKTMGRDAGDLTSFDRVKWLAVMNHVSSRGFLGFDARPGREIACEARMSGQVFGAHGHPFGDAVGDPDADPRLGAVALSAFDPETYMIFNFLLTNEVIYAFYEHPPFVRDLYGPYSVFAFAVPVGRRCPYEWHDLAIAYDRARGRVRWLVDGDEVFHVDAIGARIDRSYLLIDRGGDDMIFTPTQLDCAMGTFTFLDGYGPTDRGLVRLDAPGEAYFDPLLGAPHELPFVDEDSDLGSRLFGQGAAMQVRRYVVSSRPAR